MNQTLRMTGTFKRGIKTRTPAEPARIRVVDTIEAFAELRASWDALHARDPDSGVFLSWRWLNDMFQANPGTWRVLAVCDPAEEGGHVAFLPLRLSLRWSGSGGQFQTSYAAAGRLGFSEYVGFVCPPEHEETAIPLLGRHVAATPWARFSLRYEPTQRRLDAFADTFDPDIFDVTWPEYTINDGETNQLVSPRVHLPIDVDSWMDTISARQRKKIRRAERASLEAGGLRIRGTSEARFERDAEQLVSFWVQKWEGVKSDAQVELTAAKYMDVLRRAQKLGMLYMPALWDGDRMLGAIAHVVDPKGRSLHSMVEGRAPDAEGVEVGLLLHSHAIRSAIRSGLDFYDFGHGNEPYKYSYGARDMEVGYMVITRRSPEPGSVLDPAQIPRALSRTRDFVAAGRDKRALAALDQLSALL